MPVATAARRTSMPPPVCATWTAWRNPPNDGQGFSLARSLVTSTRASSRRMSARSVQIAPVAGDRREAGFLLVGALVGGDLGELAALGRERFLQLLERFHAGADRDERQPQAELVAEQERERRGRAQQDQERRERDGGPIEDPEEVQAGRPGLGEPGRQRPPGDGDDAQQRVEDDQRRVRRPACETVTHARTLHQGCGGDRAETGTAWRPVTTDLVRDVPSSSRRVV